MQTGLQAHIAFHLSGMRAGSELDPIDGLGLRPALLAGYRDLTSLRYDFPLVLTPEGGVQPLSGLIDGVLKTIATGPDAERLRRHAHRFEREIRCVLAERSAGSLAALWDAASARLKLDDDDLLHDSLTRLRAALTTDGDVIDCDRAMPFRLCHHVWKAEHEKKTRRFREEIGQLVQKLADILRADFVHSAEGLSPDKLRASVGTAHRDVFDFDALSKLLTKTSSKVSLSESRRRRIRWLLTTLESQRFYPPLTEADEHHDPYGFVFESCADAVAAYRERFPKMVEITQAIAMAGLELEGEYNEPRHDAFFATYGADGLNPSDFDLFPDYLILVHAAEMRAADTETILDAFSAGMRAKVLVQTDDILEPPAIAGGNLGFAMRSRQLVNTAISLGEFYVLQSPSSNLLQFKERIFRGFAYPGPALFCVYSGARGDELPAYLKAAAALEARAFPAFTYDPSAGADWATRFYLDANPQAKSTWPSYNLTHEDDGHQRVVENTVFTLLDFVACDARYARHFARVPREKWNADLTPVVEFLRQNPGDLTGKVPCLTMVDARNVLQKVIVDEKLIREGRRCAEMWRSLQELGGINSSLTARLVAQEVAAPKVNGQAGTPVVPLPPTAAAQPEPAAEAEPERAPGEPYIETLRCSSCNECIQLNDKMFAYDANKQAYIKDPDSGPYRQLVEAAENCQLSIIHPGRPRNPDEPGLDDLIKRAEPFL